MTLFVAVVHAPDEEETVWACGVDGVWFGDTLRLVEGAIFAVVPATLPGSEDSARAAGSRAAIAVSDRLPEVGDLESFREHGVSACLLSWSAPLIRSLGLGAIRRWIDDCRARDLMTGLGGPLEPPDIPRLLPLAPDLLFLDDALRREGALDRDRLRLFRDLIPRPDDRGGGFGQQAAQGVSPRPRRPDRIFVRDLVIEMAIGAYSTEFGRKQRVRFSVEAELRPPTHPADDDMRRVVSYDLLSDAVRSVTEAGHVVLVETVAEQIASRVLAHPRILNVGVVVEKLDLGPGSVGVEIWRERVQAA